MDQIAKPDFIHYSEKLILEGEDLKAFMDILFSLPYIYAVDLVRFIEQKQHKEKEDRFAETENLVFNQKFKSKN